MAEIRLRRRHIVGPLVSYAIFCLVIGVLFGEMTFRLQRIPVGEWHPFQANEMHAGAMLQDVAITASDGVVLRGWLARPASENGDVVILLHGIGGNRQRMTHLAELFLSRGYEALLVDLRAHGTSGGDYPTYGIKEADDVRDWFNWLVSQRHPHCVFGMGESLGAAILLQATSTTPFCAVVADSPFATYRQFAYIRFGQMLHGGIWLGRVALRPAVEVALLYGKLTRGIDLAQASPEDSVARSRVPVLLIHGMVDRTVPPYASEMIQGHNLRYVALWQVPNAGHCEAMNVAADEFNFRVLNWFSSHDVPPVASLRRAEVATRNAALR
jgi:alpha-beta hydrolase superfamily lysophospholipase